jgi:ATP-dependent helicase YprA (DUF1998 family)
MLSNPMDVFALRNQLKLDYATYASSFITIQDSRIRDKVERGIREGRFFPDPLIQINPSFESGGTVDELVEKRILHPACSHIFRRNKQDGLGGQSLRFHKHQRDAILTANAQHNYILTTGTGSGKSLAYMVPIVDHVLRHGSGHGIKAIIVYPMNALANSQEEELKKYLGPDSADRHVRFERYTGQDESEKRQRIIQSPPDILLTNYVMLELMMTRPYERALIEQARGLRFLVLDELHTYRGRQGADVALLMRRVQDRLGSVPSIQFIGTSATLSTEGTYSERRQQVADVGSLLFGSTVEPEHVVVETLQRITPEDIDYPGVTPTVRLGDKSVAPTDYNQYVQHPFSSWIESTFGIEMNDGRWVRRSPRPLLGKDGAAAELADMIGVDEETCAAAIQRWLLSAYDCMPNPETGFAPFSFRLHQFISPAHTVFASIEPEDTRHCTLNGQQFVPGEARARLLYPLCFCRECGQEYYTVRRTTSSHHERQLLPRDFGDQQDDEGSEVGYLYIGSSNPWSEDFDQIADRLPEDWLEDRDGDTRLKRYYRDRIPRRLEVSTQGQITLDGQECYYIPAPFQFCLNCGVTYAPRQGEFSKLALLSSEGRSSATTILSLSTVQTLHVSDLAPEAHKLLSFTDNRQDASLQAGHFNDFIEVALLRGALFRAVDAAGERGLRHDEVSRAVFDALNLRIEQYASEPSVRFQALTETQKALQQVLGYRVYRDLRRGWRVALPNLEQCGLLQIEYEGLEDVCAAEDVWGIATTALTSAKPPTRAYIAKVLLDTLRRDLALKVEYLDPVLQDRIKQVSYQRLREPWAIDEDEQMQFASIAFPRASGKDDSQGHRYLSARGRFGAFLRRSGTFPNLADKISIEDTNVLIWQLFEALKVAGLVEVVVEPKDREDVPGYQLNAGAMLWFAGTGKQAFHDPVRVPRPPKHGARPNPFFVEFYRSMGTFLTGFEAREHTAQVPTIQREDREKKFRAGHLPILYCSPTMELGVDIAELNVVNMRNVPPTPANYAQRSGRAGRSGQPALVFTYCAGRSPHDQYFFRRPELMVAGQVAPPRIDLTNPDLIRAHLHSIWLAETEIDLGKTPKDILNVEGDEPALDLQVDVLKSAEAAKPNRDARRRAEHFLSMIDGVENPGDLLDATFKTIVRAFDLTCDRWRELYRSALKQAEVQGRIVRDASRSASDKKAAETLRRDAEKQLRLLTEIDNQAQSDFYSYRYFATEGFLPGYSFPRLPVSAYIPGRRSKEENFLSRPRFLAISEFGPRSIVYHEGSRYIINQVILPLREDDEDILTLRLKQCIHCGYLHPLRGEDSYDLCQRCGKPLETALPQPLLKMQNVVTRRRDRINADEEERLRLGYDLRSGVRFAEKNGRLEAQTARVLTNPDSEHLATLTYAQTASLWRINLGWARRKQKRQFGFVLDIERGYWEKNNEEQDDPDDRMSQRTRRVIPYVEDSRNCLLFEPVEALELEAMASLQTALKRAIQTVYQLEDSELAAEPLPDDQTRRLLLFYEAAEGGAGVLRRLVDEPGALAKVARTALEICHFDPDTGADRGHHPNATELCEAACYDCLLSYGNQREHDILDRQRIRDYLLLLSQSFVESSPVHVARSEHLERLLARCESELERDWLVYLERKGSHLPDDSQVYVDACSTRPDFVYRDQYTVVYVDGSHHDQDRRSQRDAVQTACMEDEGYLVVRFGYRDDWDKVIARYPHIFGGT